MLRKYHLCTHGKLFMDKIMQMLRKNLFFDTFYAHCV